MEIKANKNYTAFVKEKKVASGEAKYVALKVKKILEKDAALNVLIFEDRSGSQVDFDLRGTPEAVEKRLSVFADPVLAERPGPGRPRLGVMAKEVTLLPQHWEWLAAQPGGASVTLRKIVDEARKKSFSKDQIRHAQEAAYKFMMAIAGNLPNYEEALRALFARDEVKFSKLVESWPRDIREHVGVLAQGVWKP